MRFVDKQYIWRILIFEGTLIHALYGSHNHIAGQILAAEFVAAKADAQMRTIFCEFLSILDNQLGDVRNEGYTGVRVEGVCLRNEIGNNKALAASSRDDYERIALLLTEIGEYRRDSIGLIVSQNFPGWSWAEKIRHHLVSSSRLVDTLHSKPNQSFH